MYASLVYTHTYTPSVKKTKELSRGIQLKSNNINSLKI